MGKLSLNTRFGGGEEDPSPEAMRAAICDIFHENHPGMQEADYAEHPNAWLTRLVEDNGSCTVYALDLYRGGRITFSKLLDQDDDEYEFEKQLQVTEPEAFRLWSLLAAGEFEELSHLDWEPIGT